MPRDFEDSADNLDRIPMYCLRHDQLVEATIPRDEFGAIATCPLCGLITESMQESLHIPWPSKPLLERLERGKSG